MKIVVLNDGETFSAMDGCTIHEVPDTMDTDEIEEYLKEDGESHRVARMESE